MSRTSQAGKELAALSDFRNFMYIIWKHLQLPDPTPVQYDIAKYMQTCPERAIIEAFRGIGKSYIAVAYAVWRLRLNADIKIMVVSASKQRADDFSTFAHRIITEIPICQDMKARNDQRWSSVAFDVSAAKASGSPSVKSVGISGQLTGSRADLIIADDVETPSNSMTQPMREKLRESVKEFEAVLKPGGRVLYLGTPQTEMSLYNILLPRGYALRVWPSEYPTMEELNSGEIENLAPMIEEAVRANPSLSRHSTDPLRFDDVDLAKRKTSYGAAGYALQFLLRTSLADAERYPLKLSDLIISSCDRVTAPDRYIYGIFKPIFELPNVGMAGDRFYAPEDTIGRANYSGIVLAIDPSGRGQDETGYAVVAVHNGFLHLMKLGGIQGTGYSQESLELLSKVAKEYAVTNVVVESNFGDGMFKAMLEPVLLRYHPCTIDEVRHSTQKEVRIIDTLEPVMSQHRLIIDPKVIQDDYNSVSHLPAEKALQYMLFYQMTRLTKDKACLAHDDRIDVLAIAVKYWTDILNIDAKKEVDSKRQKALDEQFEIISQCQRGVTRIFVGGGPVHERKEWHTSFKRR